MGWRACTRTDCANPIPTLGIQSDPSAILVRSYGGEF